MYQKLIASYKKECESAALALGWGSDEQAREHEERAGRIFNLLAWTIGEDEACKEVAE